MSKLRGSERVLCRLQDLADGQAREIVCYAHGAHFSIDSGICTAGVCQGESLIAVPVRVEDGMILIPLDLPATPE